jgi:hypothetical protein
MSFAGMAVFAVQCHASAYDSALWELTAFTSSMSGMKAFVKHPRNATNAMAQRNIMLAQPDSYFSRIFKGRTPTLSEKLAWIEKQVAQLLTWDIYSNEIYQVMVEKNGDFIHLCIRRHDGLPSKDWKDHQQIKNEIIGPEYEAAELFPAESRLVDTSNEYHLWVHPSPGYRFPFGFSSNRCVIEMPLAIAAPSHAA